MECGIQAFVMAGGKGTRLDPLTSSVCKPALPFGAAHRVVDFVLANLRNSGIREAQVLVQHKPAALLAHIQRHWIAAAGRNPDFDVRIAMAPDRAQGRAGPPGYLGTADAVHQALSRASLSDSDLVAVLGADHIYRMDLRDMVQQHQASGADVSVAAVPVPVAEASEFGVVEADETGRVVAFHEKPRSPVPMPARPTHALISMGIYLFAPGCLKRALAACCGAGRFDFGHDVLPYLLERCHIQIHDFQSHTVPGLTPGEEPSYWRDVGTLDAYFQALMDTLGAAPRFVLDNPHWPLAPPAGARAPASPRRDAASCSHFGAGAVAHGAALEHAIVGAGAQVQPGAELSRCVLFDGVTVGGGARLHGVLVAEGNAVPAGERIGFDTRRDRERFVVSAGGVVVVPPHHFRPERQVPQFAAPAVQVAA